MENYSNVCALVDMISPPPPDENSTRDFRLDDIYGHMGLTCIPVRDISEDNVSCLLEYDVIILPQANADYVKPSWDVYDLVMSTCKNSKFISIVAAHPHVVLESGLPYYAMRWLRMVRKVGAIVVTSPHVVGMMRAITDVPTVNINIPVSMKQVEYRRDVDTGARRGIYVPTYEPSRSGVITYMIASELSRRYGEPIYGVGPYTRGAWEPTIAKVAADIGLDVLVDIEEIKWTNHRDEHIGRMSTYKLAIYLHQLDAYGRNVIDCAVAGLPCVCYEDTNASRVLYPSTSITPCRYEQALDIADRLFRDRLFYDNVVLTATTNLLEYSYEAAAIKFRSLISSLIQGGS